VGDRPINLRCSKCRRGEYYYAPVVHGIKRSGDVRQRWIRVRRGRTLVHQERVACLDCGHIWWTTHFSDEHRRREFEAKRGTRKR
jgi:hypothetical protein